MMFSQTKAPLFQFSQTTDFPDLDEEFVAFIAKAFQRADSDESRRGICENEDHQLAEWHPAPLPGATVGPPPGY